MQAQRTPTRAAIYVRVSTAGQEDNYSLASQEQACRFRAVEDGAAISEVYVVREVHSGAELWTRPKLTALREAIRARQIDVLYIHSIDRLSRDPTHLGVIISEADHHGVAIHFVTEPLDASPEGELIRFVKGYAAKIERAKFMERSMRGKVGRAQTGRPLVGACPPYGYAWLTEMRRDKAAKTTLAIDPERECVVRDLFEHAAAGRSLHQLRADLNARGIPTTKGRPWQTSSIHAILTNPIYTGTVAAFRHRTVKDRATGKVVKVATHRLDDDRVIATTGGVPAIVSQDLFDAVAARFKANKAAASRNHHDPQATLLRGGYAVCGHCGNILYAHRRSPRPGYHYRCPTYQYDPARCTQHTIVAATLDDAVWQRVSAVLSDPDLIAQKIAEMQRSDPTAADLEAVDRRIAAASKRRDNFLAAVGAAERPDVAALLGGQLAAVTDELSALEAERDGLVGRRRAWEAAQTALRDLQAGCARVARRLEHATYERKRDALDYLGVRVRVFRPGSPERFVVEAVTATPDGEIVSAIGAGRAR